MTVRNPRFRFAFPMRFARCVTTIGAALVASGSNAQELPALRAGLWEVNRTIEATSGTGTPRTLQVTECTSPSEDMAAQQEMLKKIGCQLSPLAREGNTYTFSAVCAEAAAQTSRSVLTVESDSAYSIRIESTLDGTQSRELLRAKRVGDCPP